MGPAIIKSEDTLGIIKNPFVQVQKRSESAACVYTLHLPG
jgi:hypothetical protein